MSRGANRPGLFLLCGLSLLLITCKKETLQISHPDPLREKDAAFIVWNTIRDTGAVIRKYLSGVKMRQGYTQTYQVTRTGSYQGGYQYTLQLDDIIFVNAERPSGFGVVINGHLFLPTYVNKTGSCWHHYTLSVPYASIGLSNAGYAGTPALSLTYYFSGEPSPVNSETLALVSTDACGVPAGNTGVITAHSSYPPIIQSVQSGSVNLGILISPCSDAGGRWPESYTFQYRRSSIGAAWTSVTVPYPNYLNYNVVLPNGTYDLQGNNRCDGGATANTGPTVPGSTASFTVPL